MRRQPLDCYAVYTLARRQKAVARELDRRGPGLLPARAAKLVVYLVSDSRGPVARVDDRRATDAGAVLITIRAEVSPEDLEPM